MAPHNSNGAPVKRQPEPGRSLSVAGPKRAARCVALCVIYREDALLLSKVSKPLPPASVSPSRAPQARKTLAAVPLVQAIAAVRNSAISMTTFDDPMESFND